MNFGFEEPTIKLKVCICNRWQREENAVEWKRVTTVMLAQIVLPPYLLGFVSHDLVDFGAMELSSVLVQ